MFTRQDPSQLQAQLEQINKKGNGEDPTEWKLKTDNLGNGTAVIRFLPAKGDGLPFIKRITHFFKGNGKQYYSENCTSTHGDFASCPVCKYLNDNNIYDTDKKAYGALKRSTSFWANILVIKDPSNPENEGKVFKYRFGVKIMDKITAMINVNTDVGEVPVDVTCVFTGANFLLKSKKVGQHANYEDSKFMTQTEIPGINTPEKQAEIAGGMHDIAAMVAPSTFKPFDEADKEFKAVWGTSAAGGSTSAAAKQADAIGNELDQFAESMDQFEVEVEQKPAVTQAQAETIQTTQPAASGGELDDLLDGI